MNDTLNKLIEVLEQDERLVVDGKLAKNKVVELALDLDIGLLRLLKKSKDLVKVFFQEVDGVFVFDKIKFQSFVSNKQFLPGSFTEYKNKIGLVANKQYLTDSNEVVLAFPYKDCVLEGGQDKEDAKRDEVFWNETLAPDEIDRLLKPKVLTNIKKYTADGEQEIDEIKDTDNLIIKGNNLIALHTLKKKYAGKVKLIYIDPPYNTGSDSFGYNDSFNHSTWLTFMKNRLEIARRLLSQDGSIFISIDENEIGYLQVLCDTIFKRENRANLITVKRGSVTGHKAINPGAINITEYVLVYAKNKNDWKPNKIYKKRGRNDRYNNFIINIHDNYKSWEFKSLLDAFSDYKGVKKNKLRRELGKTYEKEIYDFVIKNAESVIQFAYPDYDKVSKETRALIDESKQNNNKVFLQKRNGRPDLYLLNGQRLLFYSDRLVKIDNQLVTGEPISDLWDDVLPNDLHNEGGVKFKKGKKPEKLIARIIDLASNKGDLVLDFHIGSGTTCAVAHKLDRKYIGIEQMDYGENDSVARMKNVLTGDKSGINKSVNWAGGGSFVYAELAKANQDFADKIQNANQTKDLSLIWEKMKKTAFLSYKVDVKNIDKAKKDWSNLSLDDQKRFLIEVLEKNWLYVPYSEINDEHFAIPENVKKLNRKFYE